MMPTIEIGFIKSVSAQKMAILFEENKVAINQKISEAAQKGRLSIFFDCTDKGEASVMVAMLMKHYIGLGYTAEPGGYGRNHIKIEWQQAFSIMPIELHMIAFYKNTSVPPGTIFVDDHYIPTVDQVLAMKKFVADNIDKILTLGKQSFGEKYSGIAIPKDVILRIMTRC